MRISRFAKSLGLFFSLALGSAGFAADRPNILIVLADDQGYGDVSACNPDSKIATPHIDRLANEGMIFTDAHSASGVCTPTRYSLLTGRYHWRTRLQSGVLGGFSLPLIAPDRLTIAGLLKQHGYHTACIGKWHLGMKWPLKNGAVANDNGDFSKPFNDVNLVDYSSPIQGGPVDSGFDHYYGISASLDMFPYVWIKDRLPTEIATETKAFHRPGPAGKDFEAIDVQAGITERTVAYIGERAAAAKAGTPFFAYVPLAAPHTPIVPTAKFQGKSGINAYADFVLQIDRDVGRILDALDQHGLAESTLVVFTTDNGCSPAAKIGELIAAGHNPSHIYRGHKADLYEGGHRVPFLVRWPGKVKPGGASDHMIGQFDFLATFAEMLGATLPPNAGEDSISFLPVLLGTAAGPIRGSLISQSINGSFAIRDGDWKLALCPGSGGWSHPRPGSQLPRLPAFQLYNLAADPGETTNLIEKHPERVAKMKAAMQEAIARGRTTPGPSQPNDAEIKLIKAAPIPAKPNSSSDPAPRPNIIFLLADDLGWGDIGYHDSDIRTPHLDQLAAGGTRLNRHSVYPTCSPTRVALLSGRFPSRFGVLSPLGATTKMRGEDAWLPHGLRELGYRTHISGKWHIGETPEHRPLGYGFDTSYGYLRGQIDPYTHHYKLGNHVTWHRNDQFAEEQGHVTDLITEEAIRVIESAGDKPFFLYVAHPSPHHPLNEPPQWIAPYEQSIDDVWRRHFAAAVTHMDSGVGRIVEALERTGLRENTLIVFSSDNGGQQSWSAPRTEYNGRYAAHTTLGNNLPLRGWKGDLYEGGIRVPAFVNWPGHVPAGRVFDSPTHVVDWLPTLIRAAGGDPMRGPAAEGIDLWDALLARTPSLPARVLYWKTPSASAVRQGDWKLIRHRSGSRIELFELNDDPREKTNLAGKERARAGQLLALLERLAEDDN